MAETTYLAVNADAFLAAMEHLQRTTHLDMRDIFRSEVRIVLGKLIRFEYRANRKKIREDLTGRKVIIFDSGAIFNIPRDRAADFRRLPKGADRFAYRARRRRGGKTIIEREGIGAYVDREGYLASGWGGAAAHLGVTLPRFVSRHDLGSTGAFIDNLNAAAGPGFYLANKANPRDGSRAKLQATLNIQAGAITKSVNAGLERAFARVRPVSIAA
jgi:hypothetical protein